jgi:ubiquinone/menaquinone biosynthesis C-methylase UbiE
LNFEKEFARKVKKKAIKHPAVLFFVLDTFHRDTKRRLKRIVEPNDFILDVGSLNSPYTVYFSNSVVAIDIPHRGMFGYSGEIVEEIKSRRNLEIVTASGTNIPFKSKTFDKIICTEVLEHIYADRLAVTEMARVLKADGKAFLTTPNQDGIPLKCAIEEHVRHYTQKGLRTLLSQFFKQVVIEERFRFWNFLGIAYKFWNRWSKNKLHIHVLIASLFSSWLYDIVYFFEKLTRANSNYNLVAICSEPRQHKMLAYEKSQNI